MTFGILSDWPGTSGYHKDILGGIEGYGRSAGIDILTLAVGWYGSDLSTEQGRKVLYELVRGDACAGFIVFSASIGTIVGAEALFSELAGMTASPLVSLSVPLAGYPSVLIDNGPGFTDLCRHLIGDHGYRDIVFVSGMKGNYDARSRLDILREVMEEAGLSLPEDRIWYGDFTAQSGVEAVRHFMGERGLRPQAVICANDYAAIGVWEEIKRRGAVLPWEIAVTGFDNIDLGPHMEIPFTTVRQPFYQQGYAAARILHEALSGRDVPPIANVPSTLILRESCGCGRRSPAGRSSPSEDGISAFWELHSKRLDAAFERFLEDRPGNPLIRAWQAFINETRAAEVREREVASFFDETADRFNGQSVSEEKKADLVKNLLRMQRILVDYYKETEVFGKVIDGGTLERMIAGIEDVTQRLIETQDIGSLADQLRDFFLSLGVKNAWLNLYSDPAHPFDGPMRSAFIMTDGVAAKEGPADFSPREVIPDNPASSGWKSLLVEALYEGDDQIGLLVLDNRMWDSYTNEMLRRRFCSALQSVNITRHLSRTNENLQQEILRRRDSEARLNSLMEELKNLSMKDDLTGLFNRRGFLTLGERQIKHYVREKADYLILFADMDGLKVINDTWGHREGDEAIRTAARILEASCRDADIAARLGGDEFIVLLGSAGPQHAELIKSRVERTAATMSGESGKAYRVSLSLGFVAASDYPGADLRELMEYADRKLYAMKRAKRRDRTE